MIGYSGAKTPHVGRHEYACWKPSLHTLFYVIVLGQCVHSLSLFSILSIQYYHGVWNLCPRPRNYTLESHHLNWSITSTALFWGTSTRWQSWYKSIDSPAIPPCTSGRFWEEAAFSHAVIIHRSDIISRRPHRWDSLVGLSSLDIWRVIEMLCEYKTFHTACIFSNLSQPCEAWLLDRTWWMYKYPQDDDQWKNNRLLYL